MILYYIYILYIVHIIYIFIIIYIYISYTYMHICVSSTVNGSGRRNTSTKNTYDRRVAALSDDTWVCPESVMSALQDVTGPWTIDLKRKNKKKDFQKPKITQTSFQKPIVFQDPNNPSPDRIWACRKGTAPALNALWRTKRLPKVHPWRQRGGRSMANVVFSLWKLLGVWKLWISLDLTHRDSCFGAENAGKWWSTGFGVPNSRKHPCFWHLDVSWIPGCKWLLIWLGHSLTLFPYGYGLQFWMIFSIIHQPIATLASEVIDSHIWLVMAFTPATDMARCESESGSGESETNQVEPLTFQNYLELYINKWVMMEWLEQL